MLRLLSLAFVALILSAPSVLQAQEPPFPFPEEPSPREAPGDERAPLPSIVETRPLQPGPRGDAIHRLRVQQFNAAVKELKAAMAYYESGRGGADQVANACHRLVNVALVLYPAPQEQVAWLEKKLELARFVEGLAKNRQANGIGGAIEAAEAEYNRLGVEIEWTQARQKLRATSPARRPQR